MLNNLKPKEVFHFFEELTRIPRGSGNEKQASDFLVGFAKERKLEVFQDNDLVFLLGPAGTGKTHLAVYLAVREFLEWNAKARRRPSRTQSGPIASSPRPPPMVSTMP